MALTIDRFLREPLLWFGLIGVGLFGLWAWVGEDESAEAGATRAGQAHQVLSWYQRSGLELAPNEKLIVALESWAEEQGAVAEGEALGLLSVDPTVRVAVALAVERLDIADLSGAVPDVAELRRWAQGTRAVEAQVRFRYGRWLVDQGPEAREGLAQALAGAPVEGLGEPGLGHFMGLRPHSAVARRLGEGFVRELRGCHKGRPCGVLKGTDGLYVVVIDERIEALEVDETSPEDQLKTAWLTAEGAARLHARRAERAPR